MNEGLHIQLMICRPGPPQFCSHFNERFEMCWIEWKIYFCDFYFLSYENSSKIGAVLSTKIIITRKIKSENWFIIRFNTLRILHESESKTEGEDWSAYPYLGQYQPLWPTFQPFWPQEQGIEISSFQHIARYSFVFIVTNHLVFILTFTVADSYCYWPKQIT